MPVPFFRMVVTLSALLVAASALAESVDLEDPYDAVQRRRQEQSFSKRVAGGSDAKLGDDPWQVGLLASNVIDSFDAHFCGGVWIGKRTVITSAHCVSAKRIASEIEIIANVVDLDSNPVRIPIKKIWRNDAFDPAEAPPRKNDIVVLELNTNLDAKPIDIPDGSSEPTLLVVGAQARVTGWGYVNNSGSKSAILQVGQLKIIGMNDCKVTYAQQLKANMFCAGTGKVDTCKGDSGGPLSIQDAAGTTWLIGLTTWGPTKCGQGSGIYTRTAAQKSWIAQQQSRFSD